MAKLNEPKRTIVRLAGLSDQPASDDSLGFAPYVNALFNFLEHEKNASAILRLLSPTTTGNERVMK
jgi:hypothetical protein